MDQESFQHRSGRVISLARLSLAAVFLVAIWADPSQPSRYPTAAYAVLGAYVAISAAFLALTWNNWWLEHRLSVAAHCFDISLFGLMVYLTEGYTSPFFTFFVFIILSATIRWGWRATAATAAAVILLFFVAGFAALKWEAGQFEVTRFIIRGTYLIVLSLVLIWFSLNQQGRYLRHLSAPDAGGEDVGVPPMRLGLEKAAARTGAKRAALVWWDEEEPWLNLARLERGLVVEERYAPQAFGDVLDPRLTGSTFIFDQRRSRVLLRRDGAVERLTDATDAIDAGLASRLDCSSGLVIPVQADAYGGVFVLTDIPGLCADDLTIGQALGEEFSAALQRSYIQSISEQAAANRTRLSLARDLHDSVAQLLAGTSLRLQGLRQSIASGRAVDKDLDALQQEIAAEQQDLRSLILQLRDVPSSEPEPLRVSLQETLRRASQRWGIGTRLDSCPPTLRASRQLRHNVDQLVREAIANAVKHGRASEVSVSLDLVDAELLLRVRDNGCGFAVNTSSLGTARPGPWSLNERAHDLGGTLMLSSSGKGSEVVISLPLEDSR